MKKYITLFPCQPAPSAGPQASNVASASVRSFSRSTIHLKYKTALKLDIPWQLASNNVFFNKKINMEKWLIFQD